MLKSKKYQDLTKIAEIRKLEKTLAEQALADAKKNEDARLSDKEKAEEESLIAEKNWEEQLADGPIISEHLKYYSNNLVEHIEVQTAADEAHSEAVKSTEDKVSTLQHCQVVSKKTNQMRRQLGRRIQRDKEERAVTVFEDRFTYDWSRK